MDLKRKDIVFNVMSFRFFCFDGSDVIQMPCAIFGFQKDGCPFSYGLDSRVSHGLCICCQLTTDIDKKGELRFAVKEIKEKHDIYGLFVY